MNKENLIKLGAFCEKRFHMDDSFKIIELPSDFPHGVYRVVVPKSIENHLIYDSNTFEPVMTDDVRLAKIGSINNHETIMVGYSHRASTLVIKEAE